MFEVQQSEIGSIYSGVIVMCACDISVVSFFFFFARVKFSENAKRPIGMYTGRAHHQSFSLF